MFIKMWSNNVSSFHRKLQNEMCLTGKNINISFEVNIMFVYSCFIQKCFQWPRLYDIKDNKIWHNELEQRRKEAVIT